MEKREQPMSDQQATDAKRRRVVAAHLQALEASPVTPEETAMFEMFEREGWSHEKRLAYIRQQAESAAMIHAAE